MASNIDKEWKLSGVLEGVGKRDAKGNLKDWTYVREASRNRKADKARVTFHGETESTEITNSGND